MWEGRVSKIAIIIAAIAAMFVMACEEGGADVTRWTVDAAVPEEATDFVLKEAEFDDLDREAIVVAVESAESAPSFTDEMVEMVPVEAELKIAVADGDLADVSSSMSVAADRVIVRTAQTSLLVSDIPDAMSSIERLAESLGGWVISANRDSANFGFVSFRVPAELLDSALDAVRDMAETVETESIDSRDVTDEFVDLTARLRNQLAAEEALLDLLDRAETVEDALEIRRELVAVREEIERLEGRITLIEQTAAYSLINVSLRRAPSEMTVDAGEDISGAVGLPVRFRATFSPPEGIENFEVKWDFGDGSEPVYTTRTAPTQDPDVRLTATVTHVYGSDDDSPFIAEVTIVGSGEGGLVEGSDVALVSIFLLPRIEVYAGDFVVVEAGDEVVLSGSFTRPSELTDVEFTWDFGDGSDPVTGGLQRGVTTATARHSYRDHRLDPYRATLTVSAVSEAGPVEATSTVPVLVREAPGWTIGGWSAADTWRTIIRTLSGVGQVLVTIVFWLAVLSPVWIAGVVIVVWRRRRALKK